jgi:hypothetical protein
MAALFTLLFFALIVLLAIELYKYIKDKIDKGDSK